MDISSVNGNQFGYKIGAASDTSIAAENTQVPSPKELKQKNISEEDIVKAIERANKAIGGEPRHVEFSVHKPHGDIVIKVVNSETKEVLHEFPSEKILNLIDKLQEINGTIVDEKR